MKILVACEYSARVREDFKTLGHDVTSCDILPTAIAGKHYQGDVMDIIDQDWDLLICFPTCTYLCSSGLHWNKKIPDRAQKTEQGLLFVDALLNANIPKIALENPIGCISSRIRKPDQIIQPYQFGENASKSTCLWLKNLPKLIPTKYIEPRIVNGKNRWANQTDSGQNHLGPSENRAQLRGTTYKGIADAMAQQWGI